MNKKYEIVLFLSLLLIAKTAMAFQIEKFEKPEFSAPKGVHGELRSDYHYKYPDEHVCYPESESDKWAVFENTLKAELKKAGIYEGATVWCNGRYTKYFGLPALTKIKIVKIELLIKIYEQKKTGKTGCDDIYTIVTAEVDGKPKTMQFGDYAHEEDRAFDIIRSFNIKNPGAKWNKKVIAAIKEGKVFLGMTKAQAKESWGEPKEVNITVDSWGVKEQWVYGSKSYLYFTNDKLDSFQD